MFRQTQAKIKLLSNILPDPRRAEKAMFNVLFCSLKLCKRTLSRNVLNMMIRNNICTTDIDKCVRILCKRDGCSSREKKIRKFLMLDKLKDAEYNIKSIHKEFAKANEEYFKVINNPLGLFKSDLQIYSNFDKEIVSLTVYIYICFVS